MPQPTTQLNRQPPSMPQPLPNGTVLRLQASNFQLIPTAVPILPANATCVVVPRDSFPIPGHNYSLPSPDVQPKVVLTEPRLSCYPCNTVMQENPAQETTAPLKLWLKAHYKNPYPSKAEKIMFSVLTKMTLTQISTWFANARRRLRKEGKAVFQDNSNADVDDGPIGSDILDQPSSSTFNFLDQNGSGKAGESSSTFINDVNNKLKIKRCDKNADERRKKKIWSIVDSLSLTIESESEKENTTPTSGTRSPSSSSNENSIYTSNKTFRRYRL
uniref:Homeobox domain-containing protein n=1 Tax=Syphacia muris TaxID=451379 RepID=A0A0N5A962_9BILA